MPPKDLVQLSALLKLEREHSGMSIRQLADATGLGSSTISRLENGKIAEPRPTYLQQIASALEVDVEDFYAAAGYLVADHLPELRPYLRAKYNLPDQAATQIDQYFRALRDQWTDPDRKEETDDTSGTHT